MPRNASPSTQRTVYAAWDRTTRWFHWINLLCVLVLGALGLAILNEKSFGVSAEGKVLLKTLHVYAGYVFACNLTWRLLWGFIGGRYSRWNRVLPGGRSLKAMGGYLRGFIKGDAPAYLGHNPAGRLMVSALFLVMLSQAVTGLVLAGTDLYKPPFGSAFAHWVTAGDADKLAQLTPGSKEFVDPAAFAEMRSFRSPFINTHVWGFYLLMTFIFIHILAVIVTEIRERNSIISAMISGEKVLAKPPVDDD